MRNFFLTLVFLLLLSNANAWFDEGSNFRQKLTVNNAQVDENINDYSMLITEANLDNDIFINSKGDGTDLRFAASDDTTALFIDVVSFSNVTNTTEIWINLDITSGSDTELYVYYGNVTNTDNSTTSTYGSQYLAVYHYAELPNDSFLSDSTSNAYNGDMKGSMTASDLVPGIIGNGWDLDGANDYIETNINISYKTVCLWLNRTATGEWYPPLSHDGAGGNVGDFLVYHKDNDGIPYILGNPEPSPAVGGVSVANNVYQLLCLTSDGTNWRMYQDGVLKTTTANTNNLGNSVIDLNFGRYTQAGEYFRGVQDEAQVMTATKSINWITTLVNNHNDTINFVTSSGQEILGFETVTESYNSSFFELSGDQNITINVEIQNASGIFEGLEVLFINLDGVNYTSNYSTSSTDWRNQTLTYNNSKLLSSNNSIISHYWIYGINYTNGTDLIKFTNQANQSARYAFFITSTTPTTLEEGEFNITSTLTEEVSSALSVFTVIHEWNYTNYTTSGSYYNMLTAPSVGVTTNFPYRGWLNVSLSGDIKTRPTTLTNQSIVNFNINEQCGAPNITLLNITVYREETTDLTRADVDFELTTANGLISTIVLTNSTYYTICTDFLSFNEEVDATLFYNGYNNSIRTDFLINTLLSNTSTHTKVIRALYSNQSTLTTIKFKDTFNNELLNKPVIIEKWDYSTTAYIGVGGSETDFDGDGTFNLDIPNWYRIKAYDWTTGLFYTSDRYYINKTNFEITINLTGAGEWFDIKNGVAYSLEYLNATGTFRAEVNSIDLTSYRSWLIVDEYDLINGTTNICNTTSISSTATLLCSPSNVINKIFNAELIITQDGINYSLPLNQNTWDTRVKNDYGTDPLFFIFIILLALAMISVFVPELSIILVLIGLWVFSLLDFIKIPLYGMFSLTAALFGVIILLRKRSRE